MKLLSLLCSFIFFFVSAGSSYGQKREVLLSVYFKGEKVGDLIATNQISGSQSVNNLHIQTKTKFLFLSIQMESEVTTTEENGILVDGTAYRDANRVLHEIHASVHRIAPKMYERIRNGKSTEITGDITFCVADLYFHEPIGIKKVFSNMYAAEMKLEKVSKSRYRVISNDNNDSFFTYVNGELHSVEVDTVMGKILSRR